MSASEAQPLGILGGTFDPIHNGHLRLGAEAIEALRLGAVRFVPAGQPPHRGTPAASGEHRLAMVRAALSRQPDFELDEAEVLSSAPSFTVPTLERIRSEVGSARPLVLILGADAFLGLPSWHRWHELFALAHVAVATRPGHALDADGMGRQLAEQFLRRQTAEPAAMCSAAAGLVARFTMTPLSVSATTIREALAQRRSPRFLLPDAVLDYIETHHLYRPARD